MSGSRAPSRARLGPLSTSTDVVPDPSADPTAAAYRRTPARVPGRFRCLWRRDRRASDDAGETPDTPTDGTAAMTLESGQMVTAPTGSSLQRLAEAAWERTGDTSTTVFEG